jgi:hypothetical protein
MGPAANVTLDTWVSAMTDTVGEIAGSSLGCPGCRVVGAPAAEFKAPELSNLVGAYISILSREQSLNLGLLADSAGCHRLAKALLGMNEDVPLGC